MPTITARTLFTPIGEIAYPAITFDHHGLITDISTDPTINSTSILTPTFLDIHIHGATGHDVMQATPAGFSTIGRFLATRGTSHYLPTTVTATIAATEQALARIADQIESPTPAEEAQPIGIHLEGPFLSHAKRGVHPANLLQPPSIALFDRFQQAARGHIKLLTLAPDPWVPHDHPESAGRSVIVGSVTPNATQNSTPNSTPALDLIRHATSQGVRVSLGHTNATYAQSLAAIAAGATSATHLFNAMRPLDHREPGILAAIFENPNLYAELICDGIHVAPPLVRLWLKLKQQHAILVTDAMAATGMPEGPGYHLAGLEVTVIDQKATLTGHPETLAGSVLTLDRAVQNLVAFTHCTLAEAVRAASSQPAAMLGLTFPIAAGRPASFNHWSPTGQLEATWLHGRLISGLLA